jgi:hypothetical protein
MVGFALIGAKYLIIAVVIASFAKATLRWYKE